jgi:hypothetical protein
VTVAATLLTSTDVDRFCLAGRHSRGTSKDGDRDRGEEVSADSEVDFLKRLIAGMDRSCLLFFMHTAGRGAGARRTGWAG